MPNFVSQEKKNKSLEISQDEKDDLIVFVALKYQQYTIKELYEDVPFRLILRMAKIAKKQEAETFLILNNLINGPNSKDKSHKAYKDTIDNLIKIIKDNSSKSKPKTIEEQNQELLKMSMGIFN